MTRRRGRQAADLSRTVRAMVVTVSVIVLAGCAALPRGPETAAHTFLLEAEVPSGARGDDPARTAILVAPVAARPGYDTAAMAYVARAYEIQYFAHNRWVDAPARMIGPLVVKALASTGGFAMVQSAPSTVPADLRLDVELVRLYQDFTRTPSAVHVELRAELIDLKSRRSLGVRNIEALETATSEDPYGGVVAANRAIGRLLGEIATFCVGVAG
jgi:cholesterol transport system auxiliary component